MGLTGGIVDVGELCDCLVALHKGRVDDSILDLYSEKRMEKYKSVTDPISSDNLRRLYQNDPETAADTDEFFKLLLKAEKDPVLAKQLNEVSVE